MYHLSQPSPEHVPRVEPNGPITKIFLPDQWNPFHVVHDVDTGPPHNHPFSLVANVVVGGYIETIWILQPSGGYLVYHGIERKPGTSHQIDANTIHLITGLPMGFSITYAEPDRNPVKQPWHHFQPQEDGSVLRSANWNGPWEPYHPAGPVTHYNRPEDGALLKALAIKEPAYVQSVSSEFPDGEFWKESRGPVVFPKPYSIFSPQETFKQFQSEVQEQMVQDFIDSADWRHKNDQNFTIGAGNSWEQAKGALYEGHQIRCEDWMPNISWVLDGLSGKILHVLGNTKKEWQKTGSPVPNVSMASSGIQFPNNWTVLPKIDVEPPVV